MKSSDGGTFIGWSLSIGSSDLPDDIEASQISWTLQLLDEEGEKSGKPLEVELLVDTTVPEAPRNIQVALASNKVGTLQVRGECPSDDENTTVKITASDLNSNEFFGQAKCSMGGSFEGFIDISQAGSGTISSRLKVLDGVLNESSEVQGSDFYYAPSE